MGPRSYPAQHEYPERSGGQFTRKAPLRSQAPRRQIAPIVNATGACMLATAHFHSSLIQVLGVSLDLERRLPALVSNADC
jgi:hypothetical protein